MLRGGTLRCRTGWWRTSRGTLTQPELQRALRPSCAVEAHGRGRLNRECSSKIPCEATESLMSQFMDKDDWIVLTGAGGFIGGHLAADLLKQGYSRIRSV